MPPPEGQTSVFVNPGDSALASLGGARPVTVFGTRDVNNMPETLTEAELAGVAGPPTDLRMTLDAQGRVIRSVMANGGSATFEYLAPDRIMIEIVSADGKDSARVPLNPLADHGVTVPASNAPPGIARIASAQTVSTGVTGTVDSRCGVTFVDADVRGTYTTDKDPRAVPIAFTRRQGGGWTYTLPSLPAPPTQPEAFLQALAVKINARAIDLNLLPTPQAIAQVIQELERLGAPDTVLVLAPFILEPSLVDINRMLQHLTRGTVQAVNRMATRYDVSIVIDYSSQGYPQQTFNVPVANTDTMIMPVLGIITSGPQVGQIKLSRDPAPDEDYDVTVDTVCAPSGTMINVAVRGTDQYSDPTNVFTITEAMPTATVHVPGAEVGTVDTITVKILPDGPEDRKDVFFLPP
jgi:hypothetical protein